MGIEPRCGNNVLEVYASLSAPAGGMLPITVALRGVR